MVRAAPRRLSRPAASTSRAVDEPAPGSCARREAITLSVPTDTLPRESPQRSPPNPAEREPVEAHPLQAGAPVSEDSPTFAELGVRPEIVQALAEAGIERTFAIQELTLPLALAGEDVIGQARTGMGKTLGFGVPLLQRLVPPAEQPAATADGEAADRTGRAAGAGRGAHPRAVRAGRQGPRRRRQAPRRPGHRDLRRPRLRAADRRAAQGRRRRRRHPRPPARPGRAAPPGARPGQRAGARRGRRDARPGLPARRRAHPADAARGAADDAVLGHHARPDHRAGPRVPAPSRRTSAPRRPTRAPSTSAPASWSTARTRWTRSSCSPACCRPRTAA